MDRSIVVTAVGDLESLKVGMKLKLYFCQKCWSPGLKQRRAAGRREDAILRRILTSSSFIPGRLFLRSRVFRLRLFYFRLQGRQAVDSVSTSSVFRFGLLLLLRRCSIKRKAVFQPLEKYTRAYFVHEEGTPTLHLHQQTN